MGFFSSIGNFFKDTAGSVLGAVGDVAGGILGLSGTKDTNESQAALAQAQMQYQKELAQNQVQWRVEDAKKAGLHPLAGIGMSSMSYSPVSTNLQSPDYSFLGDMGQNLNRAIMQGKTAQEREQAKALQDKFDVINLRKANADADYAETLAASERLRLQRELFPPAPKANQSEDPQLPSKSNTFGDNTYNLYSMARMGDVLLTVLNPDIADGLTESALAHASAVLTREIESQRNPKIVLDAFMHLTPGQQKAVAEGRAVFEYVPAVGGYMVTYPHKRHKDGSITGKLRLE